MSISLDHLPAEVLLHHIFGLIPVGSLFALRAVSHMRIRSLIDRELPQRVRQIRNATFARWISSVSSPVEYLHEPSSLALLCLLSDGIRLAQLVKRLSLRTVSIAAQTRSSVAEQSESANMNAVLEQMKREDPLSSELRALTIDLLDGNHRDKVLQFCWQLFRHYRLQEVRMSANSKLPEDLLDWLQRKIPHCHVKDLSTSWQDGRCYLHLCEALRPGCLAEEKLSLANLSSRTPLQNATDALRVAHHRLGLCKLLTPEDLLEGEPRSTCMYLMQFHKYWADHTPAEANLLPARTPDPSKCRAFGDGLERALFGTRAAPQFRIEAVNAFGQTLRKGGANFSIEIQPQGSEPLSSPVKVECLDYQNGLYLVTYVPKKAGVHTVSVNLNGKPILASPWTVFVTEARPSPSACTVTGPGLTRSGKLKHHYHFTICARDVRGEAVVCPPRFSVSVTHRKSEEPVRVIVAEPKSGSETIAVEYFPTKIGNHTISVTLNGEHVAYSPYLVPVKPSQKYMDYMKEKLR